ncbi:MAG: serine/threonine-protein kinase [Planctomycetota bacterium]
MKSLSAPPSSPPRRAATAFFHATTSTTPLMPSVPPAPRRRVACPKQVGRYRIERELGRGGMGVVYVGIDPELERRVAVKMVPPDVDTDPRARRRLEREAKLLASLKHPNIATIHSLEEAGARVRFFTLELIEGEDLGTLIARQALGFAQGVGVLSEVAAGLAFAHQSGVIHCDLKPANVVVDGRGHSTLLDFGIARVVDAVHTGTSIGLSSITGTPGYMSPEQLAGRAFDAKTDIWAFGCLAYEVLTGARAFGGIGVAEVLEATLRVQPDWGRLPAQLPSAVRELLEGCLQKDPGQRPDNLGAAAALFQRLGAGGAAAHGAAPLCHVCGPSTAARRPAESPKPWLDRARSFVANAIPRRA